MPKPRPPLPKPGSPCAECGQPVRYGQSYRLIEDAETRMAHVWCPKPEPEAKRRGRKQAGA